MNIKVQGASSISWGPLETRKLARSLLLAVVGAILAWLGGSILPALEAEEGAAWVALAGIVTVAINAGRLWLADNTAKSEPLVKTKR